ncbi:MAG: hypothetical protein KatS3mg077_3126 [Candidatus Binatia bacterium]|nr:MAG: hypothetical protein KatS3mg077_3126 [Candidatus Binatia bacterium]
MKVRRALAIAAVASGLLLAGGKSWAQVQFPKVARSFSAWLVRAFDPCTPGGLTVVSPGLPAQGCLTSATTVDDQMTMDFGKVRVTKDTGKLKLFGRGMIPGGRVKVQLSVRVTKTGVNTKSPTKSNARVTFEDQTVICGPPPFGFVIVFPTGVLGASIDLADCLSPYPGLATGNIEILDVALVNADNGNKVFARPGVVR